MAKLDVDFRLSGIKIRRADRKSVLAIGSKHKPFVGEKVMSETIQTKRCPHCKQIKPLSEFHKDKRSKSKFHSYCKSCDKIYAKKYQQTERGRAAHKKYRKTDKGKAAHLRVNKKYRKTEKGKAARKRYQQTARGKATQKRFFARNPNHIKATSAVNNAIQVGKLPRPDTLQCHYYLQNPNCEKQSKQYHHWHGYEPEYWLDVIPVCTGCHYKCKRKTA